MTDLNNLLSIGTRGCTSSDYASRRKSRTKSLIRSFAQVALLGDSPAFDEAVVAGRPNSPDPSGYIRRIESMLESRQFTNLGPMSRAFETQVAAISGYSHGVATCNATLGLELAIAALGMTDEVVVPAFSFVATAHALWRQRIRPVFVDVDPATHCLDPERVRAAITPRTRGILGVSLWGSYAGLDRLREIADEHGLPLLIDSAHSFGCAREADGVSARPDAEVFSFHATKCIHALEGGVIVTNDGWLAEKLRRMSNFGFGGEDRVLHLGTNAKMNEASAAMGLASLEARDRIFARNRDNLLTYAQALSDVPGVQIRPRAKEDSHNFQYVVVEIDQAEAGLSRDEIVGALRFENVVARRYFSPGCHRMAPYDELLPDLSLPVTEALADSTMVLPTGLAVTPEIARRVSTRIAAIIARGGEVRAALRVSGEPRVPDFPR